MGTSPRAPTRPHRPAGTTGIHAVARRARVSISTVSRCLTGKRKFAPELERRILDAARSLSYSPNRLASGLRTRRTRAIGMILPDSSNPYFSDMVKGAEDTARAAGFVLLLFNSAEDREREREHLATMQSFRCDGALVIPAPGGSPERDRRRATAPAGVPIVYAGREPGFDADVVIADSFGVTRDAVRHLLHLGHRRIGLVTVDLDISSMRDRLRGYRAALEETGIAPNGEYEARVSSTVGDGFAATRRLLDLPRPPTAIFAASNVLSIGAVSAIEASGRSCPHDVSVVGYDNYAWEEVFHPRLTAVQQPAYVIGQRAAQLLIERVLGSKSGPAECVALQSTLVVRESSGPCPETKRAGR